MKNFFKQIFDSLKKVFGFSQKEPTPLPDRVKVPPVLVEPEPAPVPPIKPEPVIEKPPVTEPVKPPVVNPEPVKPPVVVPLPKPDPLPPAATTIKAKGFPIGSTMKKSQINDPKIQDIFKREFSIITGEGVMNGKSMRKGKTTFDYIESDKIITFAAKNKMKVFVNPLVWNINVPDYINDLEKDAKLTKQDWIAIFKDYVQGPVLHNKKMFVDTGIIDRIDYAVVNEPFNASEDHAKKGQFKDCVWLRKIGPEYIPLAFKFAGEADPKALLFVNEFGHEFAWKKLDSMIQLAIDCKNDKVPFHGFGLQCHLGLGWGYTVQQLENNLMKLVETGAMIHISELDVAITEVPEGFKAADYPDKIKAQTDMYVGVVKSFLKVPKKQQYGITTWGIIDPESYNNRKSKNKDKDQPLLFDKDYKPKPVYRAILDAI